MRNNAITRIIIWSIVIVLLCGILFVTMFGVGRNRYHRYDVSPAETAPALETIVSGSSEGRNTFSASEVREIEIEWVAGDILIQPHDTDTITVKEDGNFDAKYAMVVSCHDGELNVKFCENAASKIGINSLNNLSKDLTIYVPRDWKCKSLELDVASAKVEVNDVVIDEVDFDGASGTCEFENCTVGEIDIDTASGDVRFIGELNILDCDAASASVFAVLHNTPSRLNMDSMSGDLDISLPADAGFTLSMDALSSDFSSDFETTMQNGNYVCGNGHCRINVDCMSGDVAIRMTVAPSQVPPETTEAP